MSQTADNLSILFVDDQPVLLKMLCNVLEYKVPEWNIRTANSGEEALRILEEKPPEIIVSDMRMPGMDGINLLEKVKERHPDLLRFILSGDTMRDDILGSVGIVHQLLNKPIQMDDMIESLQLTRTLYKKIQDPLLQKMVTSVGVLPTPRDVYFKVGKMLDDPETNLSDIASEIAKDAAISAKVLQLVNTAMFARSGRIDSIESAVSILGIQNVRSLVLIVGLAADQNEELNRCFPIDAYSRQALAVAQACRFFAKCAGLKRPDQDSLFTSGLLHSVGKVVLAGHHKSFYLNHKILENPYDSKMAVELNGVEENQNALVGAALLALWGLPGGVINGIAFHQDLANAPESHATQSLVLHLAEAFVNFEHRNTAGSLLDSEFVDESFIQEKGIRDELEGWVSDYKYEIS